MTSALLASHFTCFGGGPSNHTLVYSLEGSTVPFFS